jgi:putative ABC transport system ATP-binding protein
MLSPGRTTTLRREKIGFVFQAFNLIPVFTATENVEFPLLVQGVGSGERQRVAVARAIVHRNAQVLADEPTANLDAHNAAQLIDLMCDLNRCLGLTFIFSTHDQRLLEDTDRIVRLSDGLAASDIRTAATHLANDLQGLSLKHQHPGSAVVPHAAMA